MTLENTEIQKLVSKARQIGHDSVPENLDALTIKVVEIFKQSGKIFSAKEMFGLIQERNTKFYSDKMWNLAKKGILVKLETRGYYRYNSKLDSTESESS